VQDLSDLVADIEEDGRGVPVLLRHYLKLGGRLLGFNLDPAFSKALDGLIVVDLLETGRKLLDRYFGKIETADFLAYHRDKCVPSNFGFPGRKRAQASLESESWMATSVEHFHPDFRSGEQGQDPVHSE